MDNDGFCGGEKAAKESPKQVQTAVQTDTDGYLTRFHAASVLFFLFFLICTDRFLN